MAYFQAKYFEPISRHQLGLQVVGTLPQYRRRGLGTALCTWGINQAYRDKVPITLVSSPMGFELYTRLKFRDLGEEIVQAPGEEMKLFVHPMVFDPERHTSQRLELV
jgi:GNAT superfamily N-acetyltransferase